MTKFKKKSVFTMALIAISITLFFIGNIKIWLVDSASDKYFSSSIKKATASYAVCKVANSAISVFKGSSITISFIGGAEIAAGEILDPIDDITERASDLMITSVASIGIQKIIYEIACFLAPKLIAILMIFIIIGLWSSSFKKNKCYSFAKKFIIVLILARLCLPASSFVNTFVQNEFFADKIELTNKKIKTFFPENQQVNSYFSRAGLKELKGRLKFIYKNLTTITQNYIALITLYLGLFIMQVIIIPLAMLYLLLKFVKFYFEKDYFSHFKFQNSSRENIIESS